MNNNGNKYLSFLNNNRQVIYSLFIIILIPFMIALNTWIILNQEQFDLDAALRDKAIIAAQGLNASIVDDLNDPKKIQSKIDFFFNITSEVKYVAVINKIGDDFKVLASINSSEVGRNIDGQMRTLLGTAWFGDGAFAQEITSSENKKYGDKKIAYNERLFQIIVPLKNAKGDYVYLANIWVSAASTDYINQQTLIKAFVVLIVTVIIVLILVMSNARLFQYAVLFQRLKEVDQMKDDFISTTSHELKTPLTLIKGNVSMIIEDYDKIPKADQKKMLDQVFDNTNRLNSLVSDLLDVSRIEQNRIKLEFEPIDILEMVNKVFSQYEGQANEKGLKLIKSFKTEKAVSSLDRAKFEQILVNLVGNAIKYTKDGEVELIISSDNKGNSICIRDTGVGMDEQERKNLFSKFYRIRNNDTEAIPGTGLGLWITKQLIETMKGTIMVDSIKGVGSQFTVVFPSTSNIVKPEYKKEIKDLT
ncbi:hypothetical protein AUK11_02390 [bacterium CG2_30_37_16]|nr:MAG: hypothetical protein AUK11_02390 [bacterium CG2_30_37_16]PIP30258.1 MAG: hypothetical protein COX25_05540 [bacterium (Candidatus Howlettbacteria) CG23_combo_of_CG06-09_8_20_14_all_37_9]PIY00090.1 MAG: hypothetical protein COZ22_01090 [bacterium (Candidatus Howlettbacteria) CG_4_10_14_3_um_filter_37_10]PJB06552.1 MAG: hypothetical protein CO123_01895 [bacterium (Candidatus Howlettbacteria) CG_4_9_14_3_um_filter_37_10]